MNDASSVTTARNVARYFLATAAFNGELVTNLKMQKLVYLAYGETLARTNQRLFDEPIEAWANGPVVPSLYQELKAYRYAPIDVAFLGFEVTDDIESSEGFAELVEAVRPAQEILDEVFEEYVPLSAFQLVTLTHSHKPWVEARENFGPGDRCNTPLQDDHILAVFSAA